MERSIVGFHQDEHGDWVADLACGHGQHVRHQPPLVSRPWVITEEGRRTRLGTALNCKRCDEECAMTIQRWDDAQDGRFSESALRKKMEKAGYAVTRYVYPPGTEFPNHTHSVDKLDAVVSGRFRMVMRSRELVLERGDILAVPRGTVHSAEVLGDEPVVSLDGIKQGESCLVTESGDRDDGR